MSDLANYPSPDQQFFTQVLAGLADRLAEPTTELPGVRCISRPTLTRVLKAIVDALDMTGFRDTSARTLIDQLVLAGVVTPIPLESSSSSKSQYHLYGVGLGVNIDSLAPIELLQASVPNGIVCYFTALQVHELTTQIPPYYHVAQQISVELGGRTAQADPMQTIGGDSARVDRPRLGTLMFLRQGVPYYLTRRNQRWLRATQQRYLNDKTRFLVTTLEQTLLDTLHRPGSCGGPAIVFEAWETAREEINVELLATILLDIDDAHLIRRVGYMLELYEQPLDELLATVLHNAQQAVQHTLAQDPADVTPLLPGIPYRRLDTRWGLFVE
jgi:hypothetical protein